MTSDRPHARQLRIALVHAHDWPEVRRGGERYLDDLRWYLRSRGHDVDVWVGTNLAPTRHDSGSGIDTRLPHIQSSRLENLGLTNADTFGFRVVGRLRRMEYDVVHALTPGCAAASVSAGKRTLFTPLGIPSRTDQAGLLPKAALWSALRFADVVTTLSSAASAATLAEYRRQTTVLPPGIRLDRFPMKRQRPSSDTILFASDKSTHAKGSLLLLRAFAVLLRTRPEARLVMTGPGSIEPTLKQLGSVTDMVRGRVVERPLGEPGDVSSMYQDADVTVLPSRGEAFGLVLVESLASGTPVVACSPGGPVDIVTRPDIGRLVAYGDPDALASALDEALALSRSADIRARCRDHARRWDWESVVGPAHESIYTVVAQRRHRLGRRSKREEMTGHRYSR